MNARISTWKLVALATGLVLAMSSPRAAEAAAGVAGADQLWTVHLPASDGAAPSRSCCALAERGDLVVVGDAGAEGSGAARILERDRLHGGWLDALPLLPAGRRSGDRFGAAVAVDGELALVGAPGRGAAFVFRYDRLTESWLQEARLDAGDDSTGSELGFSVSLHGQRAALGAPAAIGETGATGAVYVFGRDPRARTWRLEQRIAPADGAPGIAFGAAVALAGDLLVVGTPLDAVAGEETGSVRAFRRDAVSGRWLEEGTLVAADSRAGDGFGFSVALQGHTALFGAPAHAAGAAGAGAAYVFARDALPGTWREQAQLSPSDPVRGHGFGAAVALRGERALATAGDGTAAYLFSRDGRDWSEEAKLGGATKTEPAVLVATEPLGMAAAKQGGGSGRRTVRTFEVTPKIAASCSWTGGSGAWETSGNWSCGMVPGSGDDVTINTSVNVSINSPVTVHDLTLSGTFNSLTMASGSMTTTGTFSWAAGQINVQNATTWTNQSVFDIQANFLQMIPGGANPNTLVNNGTVKKSGGDQWAQFFLNFQSTGTVDAQMGQLQLVAGGSATYTNATLTASAGATLDLSGSKVHTFVGTTTGNPAGTVQITGGTLQAGAGGATLDLGNQGLRWSAGTYSGANLLTNAGRLRLVDGSWHPIDATTLINGPTGTLEWTHSNLQMLNSATIDNQGIFDMQSDAVVVASGGTNTVINSGTVKKSAGAGTSIGVGVQNTGTLDAQSGSLSLNAGGTYTNGVFTSSLGTGLYLGSGTHVVSGTVTGNPAGTVQFAGGTLQAGAGGGTINLGGEGFRWSTGTYSGANVLTNAGRFRFVNGSWHMIDAATLTNGPTGTMEWTGTDHLQPCNGATINNQGTFDVQADNVQVVPCGSGPYTVNNSGTVKKSAGSSWSNIGGVVFNNNSGGIVEVGGTSGSALNFSTFNHATGAIVRGTQKFGPGTMTNSGITAPGTSPGQLTVDGNWSPTASAVLRIEMAGLTPITQYDQLAVQGTATLGGTLEVSLLSGFVPAVGNSFVVLTCTTCTGTFAAVTAPQGRHFDVTYNPTNVTLVMNNVIDNGVFSDGFESGTKAAWNGGSTPP